jgi:hypothetical protein
VSQKYILTEVKMSVQENKNVLTAETVYVLSSGTWLGVVYKFTDVSEERTSFRFEEKDRQATRKNKI